MAMLKWAKSLFLPSICSLVLIDQTWLGRNGGFVPKLTDAAPRRNVGLVNTYLLR